MYFGQLKNSRAVLKNSTLGFIDVNEFLETGASGVYAAVYEAMLITENNRLFVFIAFKKIKQENTILGHNTSIPIYV